MPITTIGLAARDVSGNLQPYEFHRRDVGSTDVHIRILACGMCHSDLHLIRGECEDMSIYPMVPGHEIVGKVVSVGSYVTKFKKGDRVGVGVYCDSCRSCQRCLSGNQQYCTKNVLTYSDRLDVMSKQYIINTLSWRVWHGRLPSGSLTQGGYSRDIVIDQDYIIHFPKELDIYAGAPLLCAGITIWSPMKHFEMDKPGKRIGVIGLGGLGHIAILFALAFGNEVVVISRSPQKHYESVQILGTTQFIDSRDPAQIEASRESLHYIMDTVSTKKDIDLYLSLLKPDGILVTVGLPPDGTSLKVSPMSLVWKRKRIAGSFVGGISEIEAMLKFCGERSLTAVVERVPFDEVNTAVERLAISDVNYRFVLDVAGKFGEQEIDEAE